MAKQTKDKKDQDILKEIAEKLLSLMSTKATLDVSEDKENDALVVRINAGDEAGLIIGNRGRTLNSIQVILGMIFRKKVGDWKRIIVDVSDWREKEEERLTGLASLTAERAKTTGEPQYLYNLTPAQRRVVHLSLSKNPEVTTESQGEGKDRYLVISPKK